MTAVAARPAPAAAPAASRRTVADGPILAALAALFVLVVAITWRKWGTPEIDAGAELTTADRVAHGAVPYADIRYFYGPLGLYGLAGAFKLLGTSFTTAFAFGLVETAAILATFYALARRWLAPVTAGAATAIVLAIAFSGTAFDFVLPHTNSATTGLLTVLLMLLAVSRGRLVWAGVAAGLVGLTRPEFAAVAAGIGCAAVLGTWRDAGVRPALGAALRLAVPALAIPALVLGGFALEVGASRLFTENLWPVAFIHANGLRAQRDWMPLSVAGAAGLVARAAVYCTLLAGLTAAALSWRRARRGILPHLAALWPLAAAVLALVLLDAVARAMGAADGTRGAVEQEVRHLVIGMSWLPVLALGAGAWALIRLVRGRPAPFSHSWAADLALLAAACGLTLRAYNAFTTEGSYAPYYAAPAVLLLAVAHERVADRLPGARLALRGALAAVAAGLAAFAIVGLYGDDSATVHTARGSFVTMPAASRALQPALAAVAATQPSRPILAGPADGGLYFMSDRRPALREVMLLPGLLATRADERAAVARLRALHVHTVVLAARDLSAFGPARFGSDYDALLGRAITAATRRSASFGSSGPPATGTYPSRGFTVKTLGD